MRQNQELKRQENGTSSKDSQAKPKPKKANQKGAKHVQKNQLIEQGNNAKQQGLMNFQVQQGVNSNVRHNPINPKVTGSNRGNIRQGSSDETHEKPVFQSQESVKSTEEDQAEGPINP